jgi:hypothetical protein
MELQPAWQKLSDVLLNSMIPGENDGKTAYGLPRSSWRSGISTGRSRACRTRRRLWGYGVGAAVGQQPEIVPTPAVQDHQGPPVKLGKLPNKAPRIASGGLLRDRLIRPPRSQNPRRRFLGASCWAQGRHSRPELPISSPASRLASTTISARPWMPLSMLSNRRGGIQELPCTHERDDLLEHRRGGRSDSRNWPALLILGQIPGAAVEDKVCGDLHVEHSVRR